ncbi:helix-turn-helix domain-containing protein [Clostridium tetani]|uniref:helix-turn-helix domain-containing protein n=1 Tax=Clostridium tetani TaxID=1513 RepID=UPI0024A8AD1A|nr:helix-turn-helix transcriptional regulator [Clostridium tetani]
MKVGENIKKYRKKKGLTQKELAKKINLSEISIRRYEKNINTPTIEVLNKIAEALEVPVSALIDEPFSQALLNKIIKNITSNDPIKEISDLTNIDISYLLYTYSSNAEFSLDTERKLLSLLSNLNKHDLKLLYDDITLSKNYIVENETINFIESLLDINNAIKINHEEYLNNENFHSLIKSRIFDKNKKYNVLITDSIINNLIYNIDNLIDFELFKIKERNIKNTNSNDNK